MVESEEIFKASPYLKMVCILAQTAQRNPHIMVDIGG